MSKRWKLFFSCFLSSYRTLPNLAIPLLDQASDQMTYLRETIAELVEKKGDPARAKDIKAIGCWITGDEGCLIAYHLLLPIRLMTVNQEGEKWGIDDRLFFRKADQAEENIDWHHIAQDQRPTDYILIVDLQNHFVYVQKRQTKDQNLSPSPSDCETSALAMECDDVFVSTILPLLSAKRKDVLNLRLTCSRFKKIIELEWERLLPPYSFAQMC